MNNHLKKLQDAIEPLRLQIINHGVYRQINSIQDLCVFMDYHIYAVWDFMSLLKALQNNLTCTTIPWFPVGSANTRYLINEIVCGEESDIDSAGIRKSHYELYLEAMEQCGADALDFNDFISAAKISPDLNIALTTSRIPYAASEFVRYTFNIINSGKPYLQAAVFTFGREDLIPGMFLSIINDLDDKFPGNVSKLKYYLERHIEVDGAHHSNLALEMTAELCGNDAEKWKDATTAAITALQKRIDLWDAVSYKIVSNTVLAV